MQVNVSIPRGFGPRISHQCLDNQTHYSRRNRGIPFFASRVTNGKTAMNTSKKIQKFLATHKMSSQEFGKLAVNDETILLHILEGRRLSNLQYGLIKNFMFDYNRGIKRDVSENKIYIKPERGLFGCEEANRRMMEIGSEMINNALCREHPAIVDFLIKKQIMKREGRA